MSRLSSDDRRALLSIARRAISSAILEKCILDFQAPPTLLGIFAGVFVTLHRDGRLRGCVGQTENVDTLADAVVRAAINAALHDPRFPPVSVDEIARLSIEISVLSVLEPIEPEAIIPGRHGLLIVGKGNRGLLLPQVATQRKWSGLQFLEEACVKAGLDRDAWKESSTHVFGFTAEVFSEAGLPVFSSP
jgi:AmmeMemoRadiSam system protein A